MKNEFYSYDSERGAVTLEAALIYPVVIIVIATLIFFGFYTLQTVTVFEYAQRAAIAAAREGSMSNYYYLYGKDGMQKAVDFSSIDGSVEKIKGIVKDLNPYRYFTNNFVNGNNKACIERDVEKLVKGTAFVALTKAKCSITTKNNIINQQVSVTVSLNINVPSVVQRIIGKTLKKEITATAAVNDGAEFVRNVENVLYVADTVKIGGKTISERVKAFKEKFNNIKSKIFD